MAEPAQDQATQAHDIRPVVARPSAGRSVWLFAAILAAAGGGIFYALQMNRLDLADRSGIVQEPASGGMITSPPELVLPVQYETAPNVQAQAGAPAPQVAALIDRGPARGFDERAYSDSYAPPPTRPSPPAYDFPQAQGPAVAYQAASVPVSPGGGAAKPDMDRVHAGRLDNPGATVPQGSVIQAVMETALDSTRAGFARAIVSRDVQGFDGTRVLIPKGSKLFGEYQADVSLGQKRALIQWRRLTLPDGTIMDIDSPSADPLGRAGVKGKVNTHFFQRFSGAILQSILDIGVRVATREVDSNTVIVGLPGSTTQATSIQNPSEIKPTLKIPQGASVSVMVARDLDFSSVEG